ncbi:HD domain-containing protein [Aminipila terrae]|uniref:HD domain-containing protein n=1 Tax=Aminipila terrae TaxID=2697030 RepID=A0A6P1MRF2_9FIRM|nr:HD domain-containing protein [Aminipila terrae]QHI73575.1 HD domain-containing protein [Aminipila terrae]
MRNKNENLNKKIHFESYLEQICSHRNYEQLKKYIQHGNTSVYDHSVKVAYYSLRTAESLGINGHKEELVRGALLHDYFFYDWHIKDKSHRMHGFKHPYSALKNAQCDFELTDREKNIILRHMFPLVPIPPTCVEGWIVCFVDKYCSLLETLFINDR